MVVDEALAKRLQLFILKQVTWIELHRLAELQDLSKDITLVWQDRLATYAHV